MQIVVLDGFTLNPGDLTWNDLKAIGPCEIYDRTPKTEVLKRSERASILLTNKTQITRAHIEKLHNLRYIGVLATGTNIVDLAAARERNIPVTNIPGYGTRSVAQTTIALLLELCHHAGHHSQSVHAGNWSRNPDWCYWDFPLIELDGLTMGIVGLGHIGRAVADLAAAFGMRIVACARTPKAAPPSFQFTDLETLFRQSDVISLHCPLTSETQNLINSQRLDWMKSSAFLLNTSRGGLIDEPALAHALNINRIAGAGLDVLSVEPPPPNHPLLTAKNCIITPHLAWATRAARSRLMHVAVENIRAFVAGSPQNVVN